MVKLSFLDESVIEAILKDHHNLWSWLISQLCSGVDENVVRAFAELVFAPIDASFSDDAPLLPSGFRLIPIDSSKVI